MGLILKVIHVKLILDMVLSFLLDYIMHVKPTWASQDWLILDPPESSETRDLSNRPQVSMVYSF